MSVGFTHRSIVSCPFPVIHKCQEKDAVLGPFYHEVDGGVKLMVGWSSK